METLFLSEEFKQAWRHTDPFAEVFRLQGRVFRRGVGRKTLCFELNGKSYFAKIHNGVGWGEILKNLLQLKRPAVGADQEWRAIRHLRAIAVPTMTVAAFGSRGINPARRHSFIITEALIDTVSLEDFTRDWPLRPPAHRLKVALIEQVATITRQMHASGMNHRDCYICHFLLDLSSSVKDGITAPIRIYLIDLHRAQIRARVPHRWRIKDLAGLYFSAMDIGLTKADRVRFIRVYERRALCEVDPVLWKTVARKAMRLYRKEQGRLDGRSVGSDKQSEQCQFPL